VCPVFCPLLFVFVCCTVSSVTFRLLTEHAYTYKVDDDDNLIPEHPYSVNEGCLESKVETYCDIACNTMSRFY
jgi:hypothetical protein